VRRATPAQLLGDSGPGIRLCERIEHADGRVRRGVTSAPFGAVPAVVRGDVGTIIVALLWKLLSVLRSPEKPE
jgi:hypothetical protein